MKRAPPLLAFIVGALALALTLGLWTHERRSEQARLRAIFDFSLRQTATRIEQRVADYEQMLRGLQGLYLVGTQADRAAFERYVETVMSGPDAAGLQGFSVMPLVEPAQVEAFTAARRAEGAPGYGLHPPGQRAAYAPIAFTAPRRPGIAQALGFDALSEPTRRAAMLQARDSGNVALTRRLRLMVEPAQALAQPGFLMYLPVYRPGMPLDTLDARRAALSGWVSLSFRVDDLMATLYGEESPGLALSLFDGAGIAPDTRMYGSPEPASAAHDAARFEAQEYIAFAGHAWTLEMRALPEFDLRHGEDVADVILGAGLALSVLLALLAFELLTARARATAAAEAMTRELRASEEQLREAQKMEAIGTLAGGIAHDFNNILAAILGNVAVARQDAAAGAAHDASLAQIERSAVRARALVQQILTFSRMQAQELRTQALQPMIEETLEMLRAAMPQAVSLELHLPAEPAWMRADATQMQQVVMNLCTNAWHALPGGHGRIEVGVAVEGEAGQGGRVHLWVADDGTGMDEATRARVFEPFFTTKQVGHGTGLGLAVVHGIVSVHGGVIQVESALGVGTRFELAFPLQLAPAGPPPEVPAPLPAPRGTGQRVLVVDDDPAMVLMTETLLQRAGYRVSSFEQPLAALAAASAGPEAFDLVVSDFNMPDLNGMELARAVAGFAPGLPVVITSGFITDEMRQQAAALDIALLQKEYTLERLAGLVHALLSRRAFLAGISPDAGPSTASATG